MRLDLTAWKLIMPITSRSPPSTDLKTTVFSSAVASDNVKSARKPRGNSKRHCDEPSFAEISLLYAVEMMPVAADVRQTPTGFFDRLVHVENLMEHHR